MEQQIEEYVPLVSSVVRRIGNVPPHLIDDAIQEGMLGLLDASAKFKPDAGATFLTYASIRVRGAVLDFLRSQDVLSRDARQTLHQIDQAVSELAADATQRADDETIAAMAGVSLKKLALVRAGASLQVPESLTYTDGEHGGEERTADSHDVFEEVARNHDRRYVRYCLKVLGGRLREALELYYLHDLTMAEVAVRMGVTESRVSQLHTEAIPKLRKIFEAGRLPEPLQLQEEGSEMRQPIERMCQRLDCEERFIWQPPPVGGRVPKYCPRHRYSKTSGAPSRRLAVAVAAAREAQQADPDPEPQLQQQALQVPEVVVPYLPKAPTANDYAQVLADMEAKRDALNEAIAALRNVASLVGLPPVAAPRAMVAAA